MKLSMNKQIATLTISLFVVIIIQMLNFCFYYRHHQTSIFPHLYETENELVNNHINFLYRNWKNNGSNGDDGAIDAVFLYVNGSDPVLKNILSTYSSKPDWHRYRDFGQLRYGMRSVNMYAPWVRNIYLVVSDVKTQCPYWLNTTYEGVKVIEHADIWPFDINLTLPSFNSHAIEWSLVNIPGSSENVWYFNDDFALLKHIDPHKDIWTDETRTKVILYEAWEATFTFRKRRNHYGNALAFVRKLYDKRFGIRRSRKVGAHIPWLMNTKIMRMIIDDFEPNIINMFSNGPFRTNEDMQTMFAYQQYIQSKKDVSNYTVYGYNKEFSMQFCELSDNLRANRKLFTEILFDNDSKYLCMQDNFKNPSNEVIDEIIQFYEKMYPVIAPWELSVSD